MFLAPLASPLGCVHDGGKIMTTALGKRKEGGHRIVSFRLMKKEKKSQNHHDVGEEK